MEDVYPSRGTVRFSVFEVDLRSGELRKQGVKVKLQEQPFQILRLLLERPGEVVTREELRQRIWSADTFVDFDQGLHNAILRLRHALSDSAGIPRFIETIPRRGYRFIGGMRGSAGRIEEVASSASEFLDSIVVLPFENAGGDPETEYLSDGITTTIINNLSQLRKLRVVPRTTAFRYKGRASDIAQVGRELGVRVLLSGQIAQHGDGLILNAELIDTIHESQLWGANYKRTLEDLFSVQAELAGGITEKLRLRLNDDERKQLAKRPTQSREAYHLYLKAMHWANKWTSTGVQKGLEYTRQAIDADPVYAEAWSALAYLYVLIGFFGGATQIETFAKAKAAAFKALEIDDGEADAHATLAFVHLIYDWDWEAAKAELLRAIELDPNLASGHYVYSHWYLTQKSYEGAMTEAKLALDIDPLSVRFNNHVGVIHYFHGRYEQAIEQLRQTNELDQSFVPAHQFLAFAYARNGMPEDAVREAGLGRELAENDLNSEALWGMVSALNGKPLEARRVLDKLKQESEPPKFSFAYYCAALHSLLGERDEAFAYLDKAWRVRALPLAYAALAPELESLRDDPRFRDVLHRIGIPGSKT